MKPRIPLRAAGVVAVLIAAWTHAWLINPGRELFAGLRTFISGGEVWANTELVTHADPYNQVSWCWVVLGLAALGLGMLAAGLQLVAGLRAVRRLAVLGAMLGGLAALAAVGFVLMGPSGPAFSGLQIGWSFWLFLVGIMAGVAATLA